MVNHYLLKYQENYLLHKLKKLRVNSLGSLSQQFKGSHKIKKNWSNTSQGTNPYN